MLTVVHELIHGVTIDLYEKGFKDIEFGGSEIPNTVLYLQSVNKVGIHGCLNARLLLGIVPCIIGCMAADTFFCSWSTDDYRCRWSIIPTAKMILGQ